MFAVLCKKLSNEIIGIVENVKSVSDSEITGQDAQLKGINTDEAIFKVLDYEIVLVQEMKEFPEYLTPAPTEENPFPSPEFSIIEKPVDVIKFKKGEEEFGIGDIFDLSQEIDLKGQLEKSESEMLKKELSDLKQQLTQAQEDNLTALEALTEVYEMILSI